MSYLVCSAETCVHNNDRFCCKGTILVDGAQAKKPSETSCSSFDERVQCGCKNQYETPSRALNVECEAVSCVYNEGRKCTADEISIAGHNAKVADQTECATYQSR